MWQSVYSKCWHVALCIQVTYWQIALCIQQVLTLGTVYTASTDRWNCAHSKYCRVSLCIQQVLTYDTPDTAITNMQSIVPSFHRPVPHWHFVLTLPTARCHRIHGGQQQTGSRKRGRRFRGAHRWDAGRLRDGHPWTTVELPQDRRGREGMVCYMSNQGMTMKYGEGRFYTASSGVPRKFVSGVGVFNNFRWGQRTERMGIWER